MPRRKRIEGRVLGSGCDVEFALGDSGVDKSISLTSDPSLIFDGPIVIKGVKSSVLRFPFAFDVRGYRFWAEVL